MTDLADSSCVGSLSIQEKQIEHRHGQVKEDYCYREWLQMSEGVEADFDSESLRLAAVAIIEVGRDLLDFALAKCVVKDFDSATPCWFQEKFLNQRIIPFLYLHTEILRFSGVVREKNLSWKDKMSAFSNLKYGSHISLQIGSISTWNFPKRR